MERFRVGFPSKTPPKRLGGLSFVKSEAVTSVIIRLVLVKMTCLLKRIVLFILATAEPDQRRRSRIQGIRLLAVV